MSTIFVILNKDGTFWQKRSFNNRRGIYAYKSEAKALAVLKQTKTNSAGVEIRKFTEDETIEHNP